jgi:acyl-CoA thioesterase-1
VANGLKKLDIWLGTGRWDVIHFNFGIHDRVTPLTEYAQRLEQLHERLRSTGAKLIWASSTPLPSESRYGPNAAIVERNEAASAVMVKNDTPVDDLYSYILPKISEYQKTNDVHFSDAGYDYLGEHVAQEIGRLLQN